jgi:competence protein ComFC
MTFSGRVKAFLLDLLFPARCIGCRGRGSWLCDSCRDRLPILPVAHCRRCAIPLAGVAVCPRCWRDPPPFEAIHCGFLFDGTIRQGIHQLKYRRAQHLAEPLANALLYVVGELPPELELIVPVPLHPQRQAERGYNQSALLATVVAKRLGRPMRPNALVRIRDTSAQMGLPAAKRWENVKGAFASREPELQGRAVLLVDDVTTTNSTLRAASLALRQAGVTRIEVLVLARTP